MDTRLLELRCYLDKLLNSKKVSFKNLKVESIPKSPGIYRIFKKNSMCYETIYVGQSKNLSRRIYKNHYIGGVKYSTLVRKLLYQNIYKSVSDFQNFLNKDCFVQYIEIADTPTRMSVEHYLISVLQPKYNY